MTKLGVREAHKPGVTCQQKASRAMLPLNGCSSGYRWQAASMWLVSGAVGIVDEEIGAPYMGMYGSVEGRIRDPSHHQEGRS